MATMEIRRIEHGEVITEPGFYEMPINWYHDNCCDGVSVSSSGLRTIELETPLHFWDTFYLNPEHDPEAKKDVLEAEHFRLGRASHFLMLEPHLFRENIAVRPEMWDSWRTDASKKWAIDHQKAGMTVLIPSELERAKGVARTLNANPLLKDGLLGGLIEVSMIVRDKKTGIWLKSRPDSIPLDNAFADLKVMADSSPRAVGRAINSLGYDMQMALAGVCMFKLTGRTIDQNWIVAAGSKRPHAAHVAALSPQSVYWARIRLRHAIDTLSRCLAENDWPAYGADGAETGPSDYDVKLWETLQGGSLLPRDDGFVDDGEIE